MKRYACILGLILWMLLIFYLSGHDGRASLEQSNVIVKFVKNISIFKDFDQERISILVRKSAHFFVYFVMAVVLYHLIGKGKSFIGIYYTLFAVFLYACSDEMHQSFVIGRGARFSDVLIDSAGGIAGILMYLIMENAVNKYSIKVGLQVETD